MLQPLVKIGHDGQGLTSEQLRRRVLAQLNGATSAPELAARVAAQIAESGGRS